MMADARRERALIASVWEIVFGFLTVEEVCCSGRLVCRELRSQLAACSLLDERWYIRHRNGGKAVESAVSQALLSLTTNLTRFCLNAMDGHFANLLHLKLHCADRDDVQISTEHMLIVQGSCVCLRSLTLADVLFTATCLPSTLKTFSLEDARVSAPADLNYSEGPLLDHLCVKYVGMDNARFLAFCSQHSSLRALTIWHAPLDNALLERILSQLPALIELRLLMAHLTVLSFSTFP